MECILASPNLPIGVFDSGVGGLTVMRALRAALPTEDLLYLGDTARVPYGTRSPATVERYAHRVAGHLVRRGIKALVVACNTATTYALDSLVVAGTQRGIPVIGVIEPGVEAALRVTSGHVAVIGTEGTIRGGAYSRLLKSKRPDLVLMDMDLPIIDGWEATRQAKNDSDISAIPIIALTAHALAEHREQAEEAGANDFDTKPIEMPRLLEKIEKLLP